MPDWSRLKPRQPLEFWELFQYNIKEQQLVNKLDAQSIFTVEGSNHEMDPAFYMHAFVSSLRLPEYTQRILHAWHFLYYYAFQVGQRVQQCSC